jgi:putative ABC transport system permease protein
MTRAEFRVVGKLVVAQARQRPGRVLLTSLSTIAAACIVVWVVSGYDALVGQFGGLGEEYVGRYEMLLLPTRGEAAGGMGSRGSSAFSKDLLEAIRRDPTVAVADPVFETTARISKEGETPAPRAAGLPGPEDFPLPIPNAPAKKATSGPIIMGGMAQLRTQGRNPSLVGTDSTEPIHTLLQGRWFDPKHPERLEGAITHDSAEQLGLKLGDEVLVTGAGRANEPSKIKIIAILEQPKRLPGPKFMVGLPPSREGALQGGPASHAVYVPMALAAKLSGTPMRISYVGVVLDGGSKPDDFLARWSDQFAKATPPVESRTPEKVDSEVDNSTTFETVRAQAYSAMGISLLAALFIIFTTLSMGVDERIRQFAMLRAISLTKWQVGAMVTLESLSLGLIGWAGGLLAGWGLLAVMAKLRPESVSEGAALGWWCVGLSGACALGGSLAASIMPAWRATSVSPLEAMVPRQRSYSGRLPWLLTIAGLTLIAVNPLVVFYLPMKDTARYGISAAIGCTSMAVGFILLAPLAVVLTERILGPLLARLLGLNVRLLVTQLSSNMGRTVGTTVAMTIGLGLFVAMQTWGYSMLAPFTPGDWTPDLILSIAPAGIPDSEFDAVRHLKGLIPDRIVPVAVKQVKFADDPTGFKLRPSATRQDTCVMIGIDPDAALGGDKPLFNFEFVEGTRAGAILQLKQGRHCLVPDHFARESGLGLGGKFRVIPPDDPENPVEYEIAGVVSMPGWHWMTKSIRRGRAAGLMFSPYETVRRDFNTGRASVFWGDMDGSATEDQIKAAVLPIAARNFDAKLAQGPSGNPAGTEGTRRPGVGRRGPPAANVTLASADGVRKQIRERADNIIWALSELPLVTLLVTSLGVINTVLSSIRARRWDLGVLRALGLSRSGLFRLIVAEALLIGVVACVLSLGFGAMAGYCGTGVTRYINIRGGQITPLVIPWAKLSVGFAIAMGLCLLAAVWPAFITGRTEPLRLLQAGRSAS